MVTGPPPPSDSTDTFRLVQALDALGNSAKAVVMRAHHEAYRYASHYIGTAHILLALVSDISSPLTAALHARAAGPEVIRSRFEQRTGAKTPHFPRVVHLAYSTNAKSVVITAARRAHDDASATTPEHLWWAMSRAHFSAAGRILADLGQLGYLQRVCAEVCPDEG
jgi:ATP-dependent Clp protease ATP-binding subunit ClpA